MVEPSIVVLERNHSGDEVFAKYETKSIQEGVISVCTQNVCTYSVITRIKINKRGEEYPLQII